MYIVTKNNLLHPNQSGFRENHSCHTALTSLVDQWLSNINNKKKSGVLLWSLWWSPPSKIGSVWIVSGDTLLASFIKDRKQTVHLNASTSDGRSLKCSVLGLWLFKFHQRPPSIHQSMLWTFRGWHNNPLQYVKMSLQKSISSLLEWAEFNRMSLHLHRAKFKLITTR